MLFTSISFLFLFLPISIVFHFFAARLGEGMRLCALILTSILVFAVWDVRTGLVLATSIVVNYSIAGLLQQARDDEHGFQTNMFLLAGIAFNLAVLGAFRYATFLVGSTNFVFGSNTQIGKFLAPLCVLFFSCDQIAYLVDLKRGKTRHAELLPYLAFASFFPRLTAGPLLRYEQIGSQWGKTNVNSEDLASGIATLAIGLAKTILLGGAVAPIANLVFSAAASGEEIDLFAAWTGVLAFSCQIYFDLSGYADIAIGIARCFGISLPVNYRSPYRSQNVTEFWQRWNITLAAFLLDYVYYPLGGNRGNIAHVALNIVITMIVAGLWYGAGKMFIAWALSHSFYLFLHRIWRALGSRSETITRFRQTRVARTLGTIVTFVAVSLAWIIFRVPDSGAGLTLFAALFGQHGAMLPSSFAPFLSYAHELGVVFAPIDGALLIKAWAWLAVCLIVIFVFPNTETLLSSFATPNRKEDGIPRIWPLRWIPSPVWALALGTIMFTILVSQSEANVAIHWRF